MSEAFTADVFLLAAASAWLWVSFWLLPKMEKTRPGFFDFLVEQTGPWILWFIIIWTMLCFGAIASTLAKWGGADEAGVFAIAITAQWSFWFWMRLQVGAKLDRFKIY